MQVYVRISSHDLAWQLIWNAVTGRLTGKSLVADISQVDDCVVDLDLPDGTIRTLEDQLASLGFQPIAIHPIETRRVFDPFETLRARALDRYTAIWHARQAVLAS